MLRAPSAYTGLAGEYDLLLGPLAERTWRLGVLVEIAGLDLAVEWRREVDFLAAERVIQQETIPFDLLVIDLLVPRSDAPTRQEPVGLDLIDAARIRSDRSFIMAVSVGDEYGPRLFDKARRHGANLALHRWELSNDIPETSPQRIAGEIAAHMRNNDSSPDVAISFEDDPGVQALAHEVGCSTLVWLYRRVLGDDVPDLRSMHVRGLVPGASGARICAVTADLPGFGTRHHVMKLSKDIALLSRELERTRAANAKLPPHLIFRHQPESLIGPSGGWYALAGPLLSEAVTLRSWLSTRPASSIVDSVMAGMFVDGLAGLYQESRHDEEDALALLAFPAYRQARVIHAMRELSEAMARDDGCGIGNVEEVVSDVTAFVVDRTLPRLPRLSVPKQTYANDAHGDLHSGNIMIYGLTTAPRAMIIDSSEFGPDQHWATDPARLVVDLVVRTLDAGAESMFFTRFAGWRSLLARVGAGEADLGEVAHEPANAAPAAAVSWMLAKLPVLLHWDALRWEWHLALATYLLRASYQTDLPPPKRALALVSGHDELVAAATALRTSRNT